MATVDVEVPPSLRRYVIEDERLVAASRRHPMVIAEPACTTLFGLVVAIYLSVNAPNAATLVWVLWFVLLGRAVVEFWLWWTDWFAATSSRLLLTYGILHKKVAMMPLTKVTDMSYNRTIPGRIFGYGQFVMESAGQDQALREVNFLPHPDELYRKIIGEIFHKKPPVNRRPQPIALARATRRTRWNDEEAPDPWEGDDETYQSRFPGTRPQPASRTRNTAQLRLPQTEEEEPDPSEDD